MKRRFLYINIILTLIFLFAFSSFAFARRIGSKTMEDTQKPPSEGLKYVESLKFPPLQFQFPKVGREIKRVKLSNGIILYLREDHTSPDIQIYGIIRTGCAYETKDEHGVAFLTGKVLRTGGTKMYSPYELNKKLEYMAASLTSSMHREAGVVKLDILSSQVDEGLNILYQVLRYPAFDEKELKLAKDEIKEEIRRRNDNIRKILAREFFKKLYPGYCKGWEYEWNIVKRISRKDLIKWHKRFYRPSNMMFAVVGDFKTEDMVKKFEKIFGQWKEPKVSLPPIQTVKKIYVPGIFCVQKDANQTYILMGQLGVKRDNPDIYAIKVMNFILGGGGFNSYLVQRVRSDEGLAYSVFSSFDISSRVYGTFLAFCSTKTASSVKAMKLMLKQIHKIREKPVSKQKIDWAKTSIINSFYFDFNTPYKQTVRIMKLEYNRMPLGYYEKFVNEIRKVTVKDVQRVAQKYINPEKFTIMVVGDVGKFKKSLKDLGYPVQDVDISMPKELED